MLKATSLTILQIAVSPSAAVAIADLQSGNSGPQFCIISEHHYAVCDPLWEILNVDEKQ